MAKKTKTRRVYMKAKRSGRRRAGFTLPLAVVGGFAPLAVNVMNTPGGLEPKGWMFTQAMTGFDTRTQKWWFPNMYKGAIPMVAGMLVHKIVGGTLGVNRMLAAARIPVIRI